jgi:hypothetical protein
MKKIVYLVIALVAITFTGCDSDFETVNVSPNDSPITDPNLLLSSTITSTQNIIYDAQVGADMGLCWVQHWSKIQYNEEEKYSPRRVLMNNLWSVLYANVIAETKAAADLATLDGNNNLKAASLIMQANAFQILTDTYGPVPFTQAVIPGNVKPVYDSQEVVYNGIISLLDQADALLVVGGGSITPSADLLYGGNVTKWRKFGKSLKLKALMRISKKRNVSAEVTALVNSGLLMSSNADSAELVYKSAAPDANPIFETVAPTPGGNRTEYKLNSVLISKLNTLTDPRLAVFAQKNNANIYVGNIPGASNAGNYPGFSSPGTKYLSPTLPGVILSYAQVQLYLAEAANEGIIAGSTLASAVSYYNNGIISNMEFNGISTTVATTYANSVSVAFGNQSAGRIAIATQMWLTLYGQGLEAWTEWRRTQLPVLAPVSNGAIAQIPYRFYYSTDEQSFNQSNYSSASASLSSSDSMLSKVWWMQ